MSEFMTMMGKALGQVKGAAEKNPLSTILTGAGGLESLLAEKKKQDILNRYLDLANNPAKSEAQIRSLVAPLNASLEKSVENSVQGYLGSRGLSESPQISEAVLSQSLAPYEQQNINSAIEEYYRSLGLGLSAEEQNKPFIPDLSKLLASLNPPKDPAGTYTPSDYPPTPTPEDSTDFSSPLYLGGAS